MLPSGSVISTLGARAFLRCIYWDGTEASLSLGNALKAALRARYNETKAGRSLVGTSANGNSVSFTIPPGISPAAVFDTLSYLYDLYIVTYAAAGESPTDSTVLQTMLDEIAAGSDHTNDYSSLRAETTEVVSG